MMTKIELMSALTKALEATVILNQELNQAKSENMELKNLVETLNQELTKVKDKNAESNKLVMDLNNKLNQAMHNTNTLLETLAFARHHIKLWDEKLSALTNNT